jgi:DNA-binding NarL/FixJ family response regulator
MIVDDHPMFFLGTKGILERMEDVIVVGVAPTVEACMEQVVKHKPNLVLLDYVLPDQSGAILPKNSCVTSGYSSSNFYGYRLYAHVR